jgi:hypothetical protein
MRGFVARNPSVFDSPAFRNSRGPLLAGHGPVSDALRRLEAAFSRIGVARIYVGRVATNAHGHARMTDDIDVCLRPADVERFKAAATESGYQVVPGRARRFIDLRTGVQIDVIPSGRSVGLRPEQRGIVFPDPANAELHAGIPVPSLVRLVELKVALWRFKDWGDVVEIIREFGLSPEFAEQLDRRVRSLYRRCYEQKVDEDSWNPEVDDCPIPAQATDRATRELN